MAGEWIKVESGIHKKPEVLRAARILGINVDTMVGHLLRFWCWVDAVTVDGSVDGVLSHDVDAIVGIEKFCDALAQVSWLRFDDEKQHIELPNFENHNGETAKKRALKNRRQAKWRSRSRDGAASTQASTREEKRREEKKEKHIRARKTTLPESFGLSERVIEWAKEKGYGSLQAHLDAFKLKAVASDYRYADWDAAFMEAIRADWARVNAKPHAADKFAGVM